MRPNIKRKQVGKHLRYDPHSGFFFSAQSGATVGTLGEDGYIRVWFNGNKYRADELAWFVSTGSWPKHPIKHINGVRSDNWLDNLTSIKEKKNNKNNKSGITGVYWDRKNRTWRAKISVNGIVENIGGYKHFDNAVLARWQAEQEHGVSTDSSASNYVNQMFNFIDHNNWTTDVNPVKRKDNHSGIPGVSWDSRDKKWRAQITYLGKQKNLGNHVKFDNAVLARWKAEQDLMHDLNTPANSYVKQLFT